MKIFLGFLFQFSIHQEIGVAKNILIGLRTNRYYVWLLIYTIYLYHLFLLLELLVYYCRFIYYILFIILPINLLFT